MEVKCTSKIFFCFNLILNFSRQFKTELIDISIDVGFSVAFFHPQQQQSIISEIKELPFL